MKPQLPANETFDETVDKFNRDPVAAIESFWRERFEYDANPYCDTCRAWGRIVLRRKLLVTRKEHAARLRAMEPTRIKGASAQESASAWERFLAHRFVRSLAFYPLCLLSQEQLQRQIARYQQKGWDGADILSVYLHYKFEHKEPCAWCVPWQRATGGVRPWL
jgi:hypothetical protein